MKSLLLLPLTILLLFTGNQTFAGKNRIPNRESNTCLESDKKEKSLTPKYSENYQKTIIKQWNCKTNSWDPWECNASEKKSKKGNSQIAYTHIKVWNCEINDWEPYLPDTPISYDKKQFPKISDKQGLPVNSRYCIKFTINEKNMQK